MKVQNTEQNQYKLDDKSFPSLQYDETFVNVHSLTLTREPVVSSAE